MSHTGSLGPVSRLAAVLAAFALAIGALRVGHGQAKAAIQHSALAAQKTTQPQAQHSARLVSPETEFEEALALRKKFTERDFESALRLLGDSAQTFASSGRVREAAAARLEAGDIYFMMSRYQQALAAYGQALARSRGRADQRCAALSRIARTYANVGRQPRAAQQYADQGVSVCMTISDQKAQADAFEAQGEMYFWSHNFENAMTSFTQARELASQAGDRDGEWLATMMLSYVIDDRQQAKRLLWSVLDGYAGSGNQYGAARAHLTLAYRANEEADFEAVRCHCESALPVFQRMGDKDDAAIALNNLGMVAKQAGDLEESLNSYRRARIAFASIRDDLGEAESINAIAGILLTQHRYGDLEPLYVRKVQLAQSTSDRTFQASALLDLAGVYARQHRYEKAAETYEQSLAQYRSEKKLDGESDALEQIAGLQAELGKYPEALHSLGEAQSLRERLGEIEDVARVQYSRARIFLKLDDFDEARSEIEKTIATIESQRLSIAKFDSRAQYFASVHEYYSLYIQALMGLERRHPGQKYAQLAFEAAERSKVRSLLDLLDSTPRTIPCDALLAGKSTPATIEADKEASGTRALSSTQPRSLDEVQAQIGDPNTVLLEFELGEDQGFAWLIDRNTLTAFDIGSAGDIRNRIGIFRKALIPLETNANEAPIDYLRRRAAVRNTLVLQSKQLAKLLLGPVPLPPGKRLLIVPDGPLQYLPFAALSVAEDGRAGVPLVELHELVMLPSASALLALRAAADRRPRPADELTVFADPVFESPGKATPAAVRSSPGIPHSRELTRALRDVRDSQWIPNLPGSRDEALAIQRITGPDRTRLIMGLDANREAIMSPSIARQRIIHFATHGMMDTRHPEMSGLVLSMFNKKGEYQDGYLRLSDIYSLRLTADLVVLSSCESALGKDLGSEGIIGLPRAFLYAGARSVIASLWKVDDAATVPLMKGFYSRLQRGEDPAGALRDAQLDLLKNPQLSDPYYWAAFIVEGEYR